MSPADRKTVGFHALYAAAIGVWLLLTGIAFTYVARDSINRVEAEFRAHGEQTVAELRDKLKANEAVLAGFASFLGAVEAGDRRSIQHYASSMLASYPHISALEVARRVEHRDRGSATGRLERQAGHYPIVFTWPGASAGHNPIGPDLEANPNLRQVLIEAETRGTPVSSPPLVLADGHVGYVMFGPARQHGSLAANRSGRAFSGSPTAILVVRSGALLPSSARPLTAQKLQIARGGITLEPPLYYIPADAPASDLERRLFPTLRLQTGDYSTSQPMQLTVERQIRFADLAAGEIKLMTVLSLLMLSLLAAYLHRHHVDLAHAKELERQSLYLSLHDPLTGLPNRHLLEDRVHQSLATWRRSGSSFALLFLDLDNFKEINDAHGHEVGDHVLTTVAKRLQRAVRESDTVARYGGDEFVILVAGAGSPINVTSVCEKIVESLLQPIELSRVTLNITTSLGISICPQDGDDFDTLLNRADAAMYQVKRAGRNGIGYSIAAADAEKAPDEEFSTAPTPIRLVHG